MHYEYVSHAYIWNRHYHSLASFVAEFFFFCEKTTSLSMFEYSTFCCNSATCPMLALSIDFWMRIFRFFWDELTKVLVYPINERNIATDALFSNVGYFIRQGWGTPRHQQMEWKDLLAHHHHPSRFSFCYLVYNFRRYLTLPYVQGVGWHLEQHCLAHWSLGKCHSSRLVTFWGRPCHASGWVQFLLKAFRGMAHQVFPDDQVLLSWTTLASQLKCCYDYYSAVYS